MSKLALVLFSLVFTNVGFGQVNSEQFRKNVLSDQDLIKTDIINEFIRNDISALLTQTTNTRVLGFIGDNYQRIRIKLVSVIKNKDNGSQYFVYGKSMVKDNVCEFQGTINITNVFYFKRSEPPAIKEGQVMGEYIFYENPQQKHVGQFKGVFTTNWYLDKDGNLKYDDLSSDADGFTNNEFVGTWTNYGDTVTKICNWGDDRIPMSGELDDGAGEFHPSSKFQSSGWLSYHQAFAGGTNRGEGAEATQAEEKEWWK